MKETCRLTANRAATGTDSAGWRKAGTDALILERVMNWFVLALIPATY